MQIKKMAEESIAGSELNFKAIFDNVSESVLLTDKEGIIIAFNKKTKESVFRNINKEVKTGESVYQYIEKSRQVFFKEIVNRVLNGETVEYDHEYKTIKEESVYFQFSINPVIDNNTITGICITGRDITKSRVDKEKLKTSEHNYQSLVNSVEGIVWQADAKTFQFSFISKKAEEILGYPVHQWIDDPSFWKDHIHPDDREKTVNLCLLYTQLKKSHQIEYRMVAADDAIVFIHDIVSVIVENDEPILLRGIMTDITEQKKSENERHKADQEIRDSEAKYRSLIESSNDGILLTVKDGGILSANAAACEMFHRSEEEFCKLGRDGVVDMTDPRLGPLLLERSLTGRAKGEITFKRTDGSTFPGEISSVVFMDPYGCERTSMTIRDLTKSKQAEAELIASSHSLKQTLNRLNRIMDSSLDVICAVSEDGYFINVSAASEKVWGYKPEELIGKPLIDFVYHEDQEKTLETSTNVMAGKDTNHFENIYVHKNGSLVPTAWTARWDAKDKMRYGVARDVTEKRRTEKIIEIERQRFNNLYLHAPSCMGILKGPDHVYEIANPLYLQLINKKDIIGKTVKEVLPELEAQGIFKFLDSVYTTGETFSANEMLMQFDFNGNGNLVDKYLNFIYQAHRNNEAIIDGILFFAIDVTEQVLSRKKIEESELRYRSLIEQATDAICIADSTLRFIDVNPYGCQLLGYSREEALQLYLPDVLFTEDLIANPFRTGEMQPGESLQNERRVKRKDGTVLEMELNTRLSTDGNLIIFGHDITERKKNQQQIIYSEQRYRTLFEQNLAGVFQTNTKGEIIICNNAFAKMLKYDSVSEVLAVNAFDLYFSSKERNDLITTVSDRKKIFNYEGVLKCKDGAPLYVIENISVRNDDATGEVIFDGILIDISERKLAELRLKESHAKYKAIIDNTMNAFLLSDTAGRILDVNETACHLLEYTKEELLQLHRKDVFEIEAPDYLNAVDERKRSGIASGEVYGITKTAKRVPIAFTTSVFYTAEGEERLSSIGVDITDKKISDDKLKKSHERFINVSKATSDAVWDWDIKARHLYLGDGFKELFGYDMDDIQSFSAWADHIHPDDRERVITNRLNKVINQDEVSWNENYRYLRADGSIAYVLDRGILLRNDSGTYRMIGAMQDVTDINRLEELLKKANDLSRTGTWEVDLINNITYWSQMVKEIHEVTDDYQPVFATVMDFIKEGEEKDIFLKNINDSIENGKQWQQELKIITAKGNEVWVSSTGDAEFINGKCVKIYGSIQDIDEHKKSKLAFIHSLEEKNIILESIGDAFFAVDKNWMVTYWNNQAEKRLSTTKNEIVGYNLWEKFPTRINSFSYKKYYEAVETGQVVHFEDYYSASNQWYEVSVYPSVSGLSVYAKDVTERKHSEIQLNELNENIRRQSHKLAASNEELERFAYVTSHDLQEPLRMVSSFLQLLQKKYDGQLDDTAQKYINFAVDGAARMKILILDLLEFSRISSVEVDHTIINLNDIITKTRLALNTAIDESGAIIKVNYLPEVPGNQSQLLQLFQNLISNAIKYKKGRPVIEISHTETPIEWQFSVKDNGIGIDQKYFEKIFIIFQRLHNRKEYAGTGIGLAICKKIVELHGGRIWVESAGEGSRFYFAILKKQTSINKNTKTNFPYTDITLISTAQKKQHE